MEEDNYVLQRLREIHTSCGEEDWDSYGGHGVTWVACEAALSYYEHLQEVYGDVVCFWPCPINIGGIEAYFTRSTDEHPWEYTIVFEADGSMEVDDDVSPLWAALDDGDNRFWCKHLDPYTFEDVTAVGHSNTNYINRVFYEHYVKGITHSYFT